MSARFSQTKIASRTMDGTLSLTAPQRASKSSNGLPFVGSTEKCATVSAVCDMVPCPSESKKKRRQEPGLKFFSGISLAALVLSLSTDLPHDLRRRLVVDF